MNLQTTKLELIKLILSIDNPKLIEKVANYLYNESGDFWNELTEEQKTEIKLGMKQIDEGKSSSWDDFLKKVS